MAGKTPLNLLDLKVNSVDETQGAADLVEFVDWQRCRLEPAASGLSEDVGAGGYEQIAVEDAVDAVAQCSALAYQRGTMGDLAAKRPGGLVRLMV